MAKVIEGSTLFERHQGGRKLYPWSEWLDGQTRSLSQSEDFTVSVAVFIDIARKAARRRGLRVTIRKAADPSTVLLRALRTPPKKIKEA